MTFQFNIDNKTRFLVLHIDAQMKPSKIAKVLKMPLRTVQDWVTKTNNGQDIRKIQEGRGLKPNISKYFEKKVTRRVREVPQRSSTRSLSARYGVSQSKVQTLLTKRGLKYQSVDFERDLTETQKEDRVTFCKDMLEDDGRMIEETFFSDEMGMRLYDARPKKAWSEPYKKG